MKRFRRLRKNAVIRNMMRENSIAPVDFIYPIFVIEGENIKNPVNSMPDIFQYSIDKLPEILDKVKESGISGVMLFGIPDKKDEFGSCAYDDNGITQRAVRFIKNNYPEIYCIVDVCLCEYTSHGHCGVVEGYEILNDKTLPLLAKMAVSLASAGADMIAPSDMMDGRVDAIREALDSEGFENVAIMSYSAKYASAFYEPFREAACSSPGLGHRKSYQMDPANAREAIRECELDVAEGADFLMVKPALPYLDIVRMVKDEFNLPLVAYNVSGEYSMIMAAIEKGYLTERAISESLLSIKRAGADLIITNFAPYVLENDLIE